MDTAIVRIIGATAEPALAMLSKVTSDALQRTMRQAAAKAALKKQDDYHLYLAVSSFVESVYKQRNKLAHWLWASCDQLPDRLLLCDPTHLSEQDLVRLRWITSDRTLKPPNLFDLNRNHVLVYTPDELIKLVDDIRQAKSATALFSWYLEDENAEELGLRQLLEGIGPIQSVLVRLREDQNNTQQATGGTPPPTAGESS